MAAAFASVITSILPDVSGTRKVSWGTYAASGGSTGGNIDTGIREVDFISVQAGGSSVVADAPTVNETLPCDGSAVTVIVTADTTGFWQAWGR